MTLTRKDFLRAAAAGGLGLALAEGPRCRTGADSLAGLVSGTPEGARGALTRVLILGAGVAGLAAARLLHHAGVNHKKTPADLARSTELR